ncbi:putative DNA-binding transcriptional regulator AlpA [Bradyrhizobium sp. USDA 4341]
MLGVRQALAPVPFSRATLDKEMDAGRFPKAREIAPSCRKNGLPGP